MLGTYITGNVRRNVHYSFIDIFILERMLNMYRTELYTREYKSHEYTVRCRLFDNHAK